MSDLIAVVPGFEQWLDHPQVWKPRVVIKGSKTREMRPSIMEVIPIGCATGKYSLCFGDLAEQHLSMVACRPCVSMIVHGEWGVDDCGHKNYSLS